MIDFCRGESYSDKMIDAEEQRGVLFTGGLAPKEPPAGLELADATVIAADSGLETALSWGVEPDFVLGDMDSLSDRSLLDRFSADRVRRYPREKDYTDTELGLMEFRERGIREVSIVGGGGGRLDHLLAIVALFDRDTPPRRWYTESEQIDCLDGEFLLTGAEGEEISLFPAGRSLCRMSSEGLKWPLDQLSWRKGDVGISNTVVARECRIRVTEGRLIMVRSLPAVSP